MNDREKKFGVEAIKTGEQIGEKREGSVEVDSPEALLEYGQKRQGDVSVRAEEIKKDTGTELNEVIEDFTVSSKMPEGEVFELRRKSGVDNRIHESFGKVDRAAAFAIGEIGQVARLVKSEELSQIADATPFVGGTKKVIESIAGKTLSGEDLSGKDRLKHGVGGAVDLGLDLTAVGEVKKGARLAYVGKRIVEGVKQNPEAVVSLSKKIVQRKQTPEKNAEV
jgi:hypothetical protein